MTVCVKCNLSLLETDFSSRNSHGKQIPRRECKKCFLETCRNWRFKNKGKVRAIKSREYLKNKQKRLESSKKWKKANKSKDLASKKLYEIKNPEIIRYKSALYRTRKLMATPKWANLLEIKDFYKKCPEGYEVDHVIPLRGKNVSGLHVPWNLQYLSMRDNRKKSNHLIF